MKIRKIILFIGILFLSGFVQFVFGQSVAVFETGVATKIEPHSAVLNGVVNVAFFEKLPLIWFQYGEDSADLSKKTSSFIAVPGDREIERKIYKLKSNTYYYFRTVLEIDGVKEFGDIHYFITKKETNVTSQDNGTEVSVEDNLNAMLLGYDAYHNNDQVDKNDEDFHPISQSEKKEDESFNFFNFLNWFKKKDKNNEDINSNRRMVSSAEEIEVIKKQKKEDEARRKELLATQKIHSNSAAEDDQWGEVISYDRNYKNNYTNKIYEVKNNSSSVYLKLFFFILILLLILILARIFYLKRKRRKVSFPLSTVKKTSPSEKYYIPVHNDLKNTENGIEVSSIRKNQSVRQKESGTFFRKPQKK